MSVEYIDKRRLGDWAVTTSLALDPAGGVHIAVSRPPTSTQSATVELLYLCR